MKMLTDSARDLLEARVAQCQQQIAPAIPYLRARGIEKNTAEKFRLGYSFDTGDFATSNRLAIPYLTPRGPLSIKWRCIEQHDCKEQGHSKYVNDVGADTHLFNAQTLLRAERVVIAEGEMDAIAIEQLGVNAVGYPGATQWGGKKHSHWRYCFDGVEEIVVLSDGDDAGRQAAAQVVDSLKSTVTADIRAVFLPDGHDANSLIIEESGDSFLERIGFI